jgi:hypothetical protein
MNSPLPQSDLARIGWLLHLPEAMVASKISRLEMEVSYAVRL